MHTTFWHSLKKMWVITKDLVSNAAYYARLNAFNIILDCILDVMVSYINLR